MENETMKKQMALLSEGYGKWNHVMAKGWAIMRNYFFFALATVLICTMLLQVLPPKKISDINVMSWWHSGEVVHSINQILVAA